ncbi:protein far1-related sequence 5, partial [Nicotiana attenuata]
NNHRKMVIFGGALMYDETAESFQWLFETFFRAMSRKKPCAIFTDQVPAMSKAISIVMPEVHHRLCVWHMEQNAAKHLNQVYKRYASFRGDFRKCIYEYEDEEEFIDAWNNMLDRYSLRENKWLQGIYALREKLFAAYGKQIFSGGMNSTQLSESLNSDLKDYLQSDYNLVQFFKHYDRAIEDKRYNELQDTCDASQRLPVLKVDVPILAHAREVYTPNIFEKFQDEYMRSLSIRVNECERNNSFIMYMVSKHGHTRERIVKVGEVGDTISCSCKKFESIGILCRHIIKILDVVRGDTRIPSEYILKRWMKN